MLLTPAHDVQAPLERPAKTQATPPTPPTPPTLSMQAGESPSYSVSEPAPEDSHVLVVDDSISIRMALSGILKNAGYRVSMASDGLDALEKAQREKPDLVITDLCMPRMDGHETIRALRKQYGDALPIIVVSATEEETERLQALEDGAVDYLSKPFSGQEVRLRVRAHLRLLEAQKMLERQVKKLESANRTMHQSLQAASRVQQALLPANLMDYGGTSVCTRYIPSEHLAGDGLGCGLVNHDTLAFYVLDVSGHGVPSALLSVTMMQEMSLQRTGNEFLHDPDNPGCPLPPAQVLERLNQLHDMNRDGGHYSTLCYGTLGLNDGKLTLSCAGHPGPLLARADGSVESLDMPGVPIGMGLPSAYTNVDRLLEPGDRLLIFTDGLNEAMSPTREEFGHQRVLDCTEEGLGMDVFDSLDLLIRRIAAWTQTQTLNDDLSLMCLEYGS